VKGGEDLVKWLGLAWVKACPEGTGGICLIFIHLSQSRALVFRSWLLTMAAICVKIFDVFGMKELGFWWLGVKVRQRF